ncbi:hypothetical protein R1flu_028188 [Riccia fluitans]|uniref:peptidyl-tRNA hydrolase n=1 Tax=Riccia fluitans TaxID=41844 RepID=A0ABD1XL16_9MARC
MPSARPEAMGRRSKNREREKKETQPWLSAVLGLGNFVPGFLVGLLLGAFVDFSKGLNFLKPPPSEETPAPQKRVTVGGRRLTNARSNRIGSVPGATETGSGELKMVFVVRQDLKMGPGKIASQCAHAAIGAYEECVNRGQRLLLKKWEDCGQPKIVVTCKSQQDMNELKARAERVNLPCFVVADAGRTQVAAGSQTVLAIGPGVKSHVDTITRHLRLLTGWSYEECMGFEPRKLLAWLLHFRVSGIR